MEVESGGCIVDFGRSLAAFMGRIGRDGIAKDPMSTVFEME